MLSMGKNAELWTHQNSFDLGSFDAREVTALRAL
jgi:hypothetical protein